MSLYRTCSLCGVHLDPGEMCDCKKEAIPGVSSTGDGRAEQNTTAVSASIVNENKEDCKYGERADDGRNSLYLKPKQYGGFLAPHPDSCTGL